MRLILWLLAFLTLILAACSGSAPPVSESQVLALVWQALEPNTTSHNRVNWEVIESRSVAGREVSDLFKKEFGYCPGPAPATNQAINPDASYWYVLMRPLPATPIPIKPLPVTRRLSSAPPRYQNQLNPLPAQPEYSPTASPNIPEPFYKQAHFLVDPTTNQVVARILACVIY